MTIDMEKMDMVVDKVLDYRLPKAICEGIMKIEDIEIRCAVLDNQARVLSRRALLRAMGRHPNDTRTTIHGADKLPSFLLHERIKGFINKDLMAPTNFIEFQPKKGRSAYGIKAEIIPMICSAYIKADAAGVLLKSQKNIAERCRVLQNGFALVGINALVDEATGFQEFRAKTALAEILDKYLVEEAMKWTLTFPIDFYKEIYRLKGWVWEDLCNGKKPQTPQVFAKYTDDFVYRRIAPGLLDELRRKNPVRKYRHHQFFNVETGHPELRVHISSVITVLKLSKTWNEACIKMEEVLPLQWNEGSLFYEEDKTLDGLKLH